MSSHQHYYWALLEKIAPLAISFVVTVIIARILSPADYGLIGMMMIFMALGQAFSELGFGAALVQRSDVTPDDETSVFVINLVAGVVMTLSLCAASPLVARFFEQDILVALLCVQSLSILIASTGLVQFALIYRHMKFRLAAIIEVVATILSGVLGISMAYSGYGVWSLVGLSLSRELVKTMAAWLVGRWWPRGRFSASSARAMWSYCSKLLYASLLYNVAANLYTVVIGKIFSAEALGLFARASGLQALPIGVITGSLQRVAFPLFSRHQDDKAFLLHLLRKQTRLLVLAASMIMALLAVLAAELVPWLLGSHWSGSVRLLQILCVGGAFAAAFPLHSQMTMALGKSNLVFKIEILKKLVIVIVLAAVYRFGVEAIAWGVVVVSIADYFLSAFPSTRLIGYSWRLQMSDLLPPLLMSGGAAAIVFQLPWDLDWPAVPVMAVKAAALLMICGIGLIVFRKSFFSDGWIVIGSVLGIANARLTRWA